MKSINIKVEKNDICGSIRGFLQKLLESKFVDSVLVPKKLPPGDGFAQSLISDVAMLDNIHPFAPTMPVQSAKILSDLSKGGLNSRIAVVLKPCELKATVELVKFLQVNCDNIVTIGVDCAGTYEVDVYKDMVENKKTVSLESFLKAASGGDIKPAEGYEMRDCCQFCVDPVALNPDISLGFYGTDPLQSILLSVGPRYEKELAEKLSITLGDMDTTEREAVVNTIKDIKETKRSVMFKGLKKHSDSMEKFLAILSTCIRCHNCMNVCPICYCKECVFESAIFEHNPGQLLNLAKRNGAIRMPGDTLIFHLTRMSHMATSCVSCGMCESACPAGLHVARMFSSMGNDLQALFEYVPGRDVEESPPVSTFKEDELESTH